jgi:nicotinamide phosphoribosyltransferase
MKIFPPHQIDFYKSGHIKQYPDKTDLVFSNLTPRASRIPGIDKVAFFGLQYYIKEYLVFQWNEAFFDLDISLVEALYQQRMDTSLGKGSVSVEHIKALHKLGYLPLEIKALPEGTMVPLRVPMFVVYNTNPDFYWLTNYLETAISATVWGACTSATIANEFRKLLTDRSIKTTGKSDFVPFQGHDFSCRGMFGLEASVISGAGHLTSFVGTDTVPAIDMLDLFYNTKEGELVGTSVPATEHSVMSVGSEESEIKTFERLISETYPGGIVSIVSDTWDFWKVITEYLPELKDIITARNGKVVIRPDSGDPADILCGSVKVIDYGDKVKSLDELKVLALDEIEYETSDATPHGELGDDKPYGYFRFNNKVYKITIHLYWSRYDKQYYYIDDSKIETCEEVILNHIEKGAVQCIWETFGGTTTEQGYKVLDEHIGLIYGDSITLERAQDICNRLEKKGFASTNVVLGVGSYTYQHTTRDVFGFAVKATYAEVDGQPIEIFKKPKTDDGTKNSAKGLTAVFRKVNGELYLMDQATWYDVNNCEFKTVFKNGLVCNEISLAEVRDNIKKG